MTFKLDLSARVFASVVLLAACRGDDPGEPTGGSTTTPNTTSGDDSTTGPSVPTTGDDTTGPVDPTTSTTDPLTSTTDNTNGFITTQSTTDDPTNTAPQPNGEPCADDSECESMHCYTSILSMGQGVCSECEEDQDCVDAGTGIGCTPDLLSMSAVCTPGALGDGCQTDAACMDGLHCAPVIDSGGLLPTTFCGECAESSDCMNGQLCSPKFNAMSFDGNTACVDPGSVPNNDLCPDGQDGDAACMSGHCETISVMGLLQVPVCGECSSDADCMNGETCTPGEVGMSGIAGSTCDAP